MIMVHMLELGLRLKLSSLLVKACRRLQDAWSDTNPAKSNRKCLKSDKLTTTESKQSITFRIADAVLYSVTGDDKNVNLLGHSQQVVGDAGRCVLAPPRCSPVAFGGKRPLGQRTPSDRVRVQSACGIWERANRSPTEAEALTPYKEPAGSFEAS
jgi:hypothetical protein